MSLNMSGGKDCFRSVHDEWYAYWCHCTGNKETTKWSVYAPSAVLMLAHSLAGSRTEVK